MTNIEDVWANGIFVFLAKVAKTLTFFLSRSASTEWTQPKIPISWLIRMMAVSSMLKDLMKCDLFVIQAISGKE